jgi:5,10-methylenetetrahydromethanopterin reductase
MTDRFGISRGVSPRETFKQVGEIAKSVENHGFEALWFIDHQLGMKDVYAAMNVAAMATEKIHIGSAVTNLLTRHPTVTANATTALDELSDNRAMLGLGAGWVAVHSIGREPTRLAETRAGIEEFRQLFSGEEVELYGTKVQMTTARRQIPIYLAVSQPGMLRLSGEICDGAIMMGAADVDFCNWQLEFIYEGLEKAGRDRSEIVTDLIVTMSIDEDEEQAMNDVRAWATSYRRGRGAGDERRPRLGHQSGGHVLRLEAHARGLGALPSGVQGGGGEVPLPGPPLPARRAQADRQRRVRPLGDHHREPGHLHRAPQGDRRP